MANLKPCPMCGKRGTALQILFGYDEDDGDKGYFVLCDCGVSTKASSKAIPTAKRRWNRRTTPEGGQ